MSYNHHNQSQGYVPSYNSQNTGAAYMARRGWGNESDRNTTISFTSKSSSKRIYITLFVMLVLLLIAAIVIIILFATGVFDTTDPLQSPTNSPILNPTFRPPINNIPTLGPPIFSQNQSYSGSFTILRQASEVYDMKNTNTYFSAFNLIQNALDNVLVTSALRPYAAQAVLNDLQNRGNDLAVLFRVNMLGGGNVDQNTVAGVVRNNLNQIQSQLGGNAQIDPNSIFVFRLFT
uniref:SEA domain-containing protein n=1 Tax=Caenorhabditis tropicalis TaxID=1561998 RepID=A0A1I7TIX7_9PELO